MIMKTLDRQLAKHFEKLKLNDGFYYLSGTKSYLDVLARCSKNNFTMSNRTPSVIFVPSTIRYLKQIITFSASHGLKLTVFSGGHSDFSVRNNSAVVVMENFDKVEVDEKSKSITIQGGCNLLSIISALKPYNLCVPVGTYWSVGIGHLAQGGLGHLSRTHSFACDFIIAANILTGDGIERFLSFSKASSEEKKILKAIRGAGVNFGIITSLTFQAVEVTEVTELTTYKIVKSSALQVFATDMIKMEQEIRSLPLHQHCDISFLKSGNELKLKFKLTSMKPGDTFPTSLLTLLNAHQADSKTCSFYDSCIVQPKPVDSNRKPRENLKKYVRNIFVDEIGEDFWLKIAGMLLKCPNDKTHCFFQHAGGNIRTENPDSSIVGRNFEFSIVLTIRWNEKEEKDLGRHTFLEYGDKFYDALNKIRTSTNSADIDVFNRPGSCFQEVVEVYGKENVKTLDKLVKQYDKHDIFVKHMVFNKDEMTPRI